MKFYAVKRVVLFVMIIGGFLTNTVWANEAAWKKVGESDGIVGYTRPVEKSSFEEIKGVGIVNASVAVIEAVIRDVPASTEYMYKCKESSVINSPEFKNSKDIQYGYNVTSMPYPVSNRDVVVKSSFSIDKSTGTVYTHSEGIKSDYKISKKNVRIPHMVSDYILVPKGPEKTEVTFVVLADPGGNIPTFVVNLMSKNMGIQTIAGIREMVKKEKYRNVKTVLTTTPH